MAVALALRAAGVGVLLTAVPALRAVAQCDGVRRLEIAAPGWLHPLVHLVPGVAGAVDVDGLIPRRDLSDAVAFNMHGRGPQSHQALMTREPRELVAFACPGVWETGPEWFVDPEEPERERFCRLVRWIGLDADPELVGIRRPDRRSSYGHVVLHVGGTDPRRRWPPEYFADLARRLAGHRIVLTGGPADIVIARRTAHLAGLASDQVLAGRLGLEDLAALIADARLVVTGDTGAAHLAHAYGVASVVVFGPASPGQWGPPTAVRSIVLRGPGEEPLAADVPVADVEKSVAALLEQS